MKTKSNFNPQKYLELQGWQTGNGLGRNSDGIAQPVKVEIKQDRRGVGCEPGGDSNFHWWEHAFNQAAANLQVTNSPSAVKVAQVTELGDLKSTQGFGKKDADKALLYGRFTKLSTLTSASGELWEKEEESDSDVDTSSKLTDDELFKRCGGRTAHKGARHGIRANGKLQRIAAQERLAADNVPLSDVRTTEGNTEKRKKKKEMLKQQKDQQNGDICENDAVENSDEVRTVSSGVEEEVGPLLEKRVKMKTKKKKHKQKDSSIVDEEMLLMNDGTNEEPVSVEHSEQKSKKRKRHEISIDVCTSKKKHKKRT